jgi:tetratricopeptide (TPR) repeat protein
MKRLALYSAAVLLLVSTGRSIADEIVVMQGDKETPQKGRILQDDDKKVVISVRMGGATGRMEFNRKQVLKVKYDALAGAYEAGEGLYKQGQYELALIRFGSVAEDDNVKDWAKQYVWRRMAQCNQKLRRKDTLKLAVAHWTRLTKPIGSTKSRFFREAVEGLIECYSELGEFDKASAALAPLAQMGPESALLAKVYRAKIAEKKAGSPNDFSTAATKYDEVLKSNDPEPSDEVKAMALAGVARCSADAKSWGKAGGAAGRLIKISESQEVPDEAVAVAYQVRGESKLRGLLSVQPKALSEDKEKLGRVMEGMMDMLRPLVQYEGSDWAEQRALYYVGLWSEKLDAAGQAGDNVGWVKRARTVYTQLRVKYPKSKWAKMAGERLEKLK